MELLPSRGRRMLEIGAAGGFFLDEGRTSGFDVVGIELNETMAEWGRSNLGLEIICGKFEAAALQAKSFDVIVAQDVLEHVHEPRDFVARVAGLLAPGGIFLVRGPLEQSWKDRFHLAVRKWRHGPLLVIDHPPYHLQGFVRRSFRQVVEASGLSLTQFQSTVSRPRVDLSSPKAIVATAIAFGSCLADRATAQGDFMIGCACVATAASD